MTIKRFVFGSIAICGTLVIEVFNSCHSRFYQWFYNYFWRSRICWQEVRDVIKQLSHEQSISFSFFVISVLALHFFLTDPRLALTQHSISYHLSYHYLYQPIDSFSLCSPFHYVFVSNLNWPSVDIVNEWPSVNQESISRNQPTVCHSLIKCLVMELS